MRSCVFCKTRYQYGSEITFHKFPSGPLKQLWINNMRFENWSPQVKHQLCSKHFTKDCFIRHESRTSLKIGSVPTLFSGNIYLDSLTNEQLRRRYICAAHFLPSDIHTGTRSRLIGPAVPIHFAQVGEGTLAQSNELSDANMEDGKPEVPKTNETIRNTSIETENPATQRIVAEEGKMAAKSKDKKYFLYVKADSDTKDPLEVDQEYEVKIESQATDESSDDDDNQPSDSIDVIEDTVTETKISKRKQVIIPRDETFSPKKEIISPQKRTIFPRNESRRPRMLRKSTRNETISPRNETISPRNKTISPRNETISPKNTTISTRNETVSEKKSESFGKCQCCLKEGEHSQANMSTLLECLNVAVTAKARVPALVCAQCSRFLQQARQFRDMVAASQCRLAGAQPTVQLDNTIDKDNNTTLTLGYVSNTGLVQDLKVPIKDLYFDSSGHLVQYLMEDNEETDQQDTEFDIPIEQVPPTVSATKRPRSSDNQKPAPQNNSPPEKKLRQTFSIYKSKDNILNLITLLEFSTIIPFDVHPCKPDTLKCFYCSANVPTFAQLKKHMDVDHQRLNSIFRQARRRSLEALSGNVLRADVSDINCRLCDNQLSNVGTLVQHLVETHSQIYYDIYLNDFHGIIEFKLGCEEMRCHVCDRVFDQLNELIYHMDQHYCVQYRKLDAPCGVARGEPG